MSKLKIPEQIVIGVDRNHLDHFNDANHLKEANKIQSIKVSVNDSGISGIQFTYHEFRADKQVNGHDSTHGGNNVLEHVFQIPPNDFLQIVYGNFDGRITSIGFITYKGKQAMFGYEVGRKFKNLIMGYTFTSASGCYQKGKQLDMLGLRVVQLPREYLELNWPPLIEVVYQPNNPYKKLQTELIYGGNQNNRVEVAVNQPYGMYQPREEVIVEQNQYGQTEVIEFQNPNYQAQQQLQYQQQQQQQQQQYYQQQQMQQQQFQQFQQQQQFRPQNEVIIEQNAYGQTEYIEVQNQPYQAPRQNEVIIEQGPYGQVEYVQVQNPPMRQQEVIIQQGPYGQQNQMMMQQNQYGMYGNQTVIIEQQQQQQRGGMGVGGAMMMGALGTMAAIDTVNMLDHHHHRRHEDIVVVNEHHHHHRR